MQDFLDSLFLRETLSGRIGAIVLVAIIAHLGVYLVKLASSFFLSRLLQGEYPKVRSIVSLSTSVAIFALYFTALGFILQELGVSLTAYLASATVIGLAVGFGSQGIVQDVVTGLTIIFSDLIDVGEMVEVSGQVGIVKSIGMRFVELENAMGARVFIPNRSITNVINYPRGYLRCFVDVRLPADTNLATGIRDAIDPIVKSAAEQYPGIVIVPPTIEGEKQTSGGRNFIRIKFRIWPGRSAPIETTFKQEITKTAQSIDSAYADWMVSVVLEAEKSSPPRKRPTRSTLK